MSIPIRPSIDRIKTSLQAAAAEARDSRSNDVWTRTLMKHVGQLGQLLKWSVASGRYPDADHLGDWLFDMTWYHADEQDQLLSLGLVLESEWGRYWADIRFDFEKLLIADAPIKVMVFEEVEDSVILFERLKERIKTYRGMRSGHTFLFACFKGVTRDFEFETFHP